jgi:2,4-dienoyl-CoA reductase (NADPH2)
MINGWKQGMGEAAVRETVDAFGAAAARAVEAGFDVVEIHGAGGYLVSQFLSPFTNSAPSPWGGGFTARTRFALALVDAVRGRIPEGCPLGFRLMLKEWVPGGVDLPEALALARLLEKAGVDYLSPSVASYNSMFAPPTARRMARPAYLREEMAELGSAVSVPTVISGRVLTPGLAAGLLRDGVADLVGLGRPLRTDPDWIRKARSGKGRVVACTNCNDCIKRVVLDRGFSCTRWPRWVQEKADLGCRLVRRNFDGLWIAASPGDLGRYREWLPRLTRAGSSVPAALLTLERLVSASGMAEATRRFREWAGRTLPEAALSTESLSPPDDTVGLPVDRLLHREIHGSGRGLILLCRQRKPGLGWGERLLYRERGKVVGLIGPGGCRRVLVPVDLSTGTLLTLAFLDHFRWVDRCASLRFVHVQDDPRRPVRARWAEIGRILGADPLPELEVVDPEGGVAETLVRLAAAGDVDTVVMGKRGLSGIKRWILGSVSAAVLRNPGDTTLFFVD